MRFSRKLFFRLLVVLLVSGTIFFSWSGKDEGEPGAKQSSAAESLTGKVFTIQSRIIVGALFFFEDKQSTFQWSDEDVERLTSETRGVFLEATFGPLAKEGSVSDDDKESFRKLISSQDLSQVRGSFVLTRFFSLPTAQSVLAAELDEREGLSEDERELNKSMLTLAGGDTELDSETRDLLHARLGWYGPLFTSLVGTDVAARDADRQMVSDAGQALFVKFFTALGGGFIFALFSFIGFVVISYRLISRRMVFAYRPGTMDSELHLEVFALYLIAMLSGAAILRGLGSLFPELQSFKANIVAILLTLLVVAWPLFSGARFVEVRQALGLSFGSFKKVLADMFVAPATYLAAWTPMFLVLILYSVLLSVLEVDVSSGAHPVVPFLLGTDNKDVLYSIIFLAVVVAPIVEETMFRGALYGWLRARLGAGSSI